MGRLQLLLFTYLLGQEYFKQCLFQNLRRKFTLTNNDYFSRQNTNIFIFIGITHTHKTHTHAHTQRHTHIHRHSQRHTHIHRHTRTRTHGTMYPYTITHRICIRTRRGGIHGNNCPYMCTTYTWMGGWVDG